MTVVPILGIHRGGTSAVAGFLYHLGLFMGDRLLGPGHGNPTGHWEDLDFVELNDALIGNWKDPSVDRAEPDMLVEQWKELIVAREIHGIWGFKDPRTVWNYDLFLMACKSLNVQAIPIFVMRQPELAAKSLYARGGHTQGEALSITARYFTRLLEIRKLVTDAIEIHYDLLIQNPLMYAESLVSIGIGERENIPVAVDFIDPELRHWRLEE